MPMDDPGNFPFYNGGNFEGFPGSQNRSEERRVGKAGPRLC